MSLDVLEELGPAGKRCRRHLLILGEFALRRRHCYQRVQIGVPIHKLAGQGGTQGDAAGGERDGQISVQGSRGAKESSEGYEERHKRQFASSKFANSRRANGSYTGKTQHVNHTKWRAVNRHPLGSIMPSST